MTNGMRTLFLTGASGVVGRALIDELAPDHELVCLRHRTPLHDPRVREVSGSLAEPGLGLDPAEADRLVGRVDAVLHCGASTGWRASRVELFAANVEGTRRALDFARRIGATFYHMSTAFVRNSAQDDGRGDGPTAYVASKAAAEELVRQSGHPALILRPSVFIGDSRDGRISAFQGIHQVSGGILKDALPVLPADPENLIDYIPQDVAAKAVRALLERGAEDGEYWLTAGERAATLGDMVRVTLEVAEDFGIQTHPPRLMAADAVGRLLLPRLEDMMTPALRRHFQMQLDLLRLFQHGEALPSSLPELGIEITRESQVEAFRHSNEYWVLKSGLGGPATAAATRGVARSAA